MATGLEAKILSTLNRRLAALTTSPALPVAWPNMDFTPPSGGGYLRANLLPGRTVGAALGDAADNRHVGIYQIDVFWPEKKGGAQPYEVASQIIAHFKRGTDLQTDGVLVRVLSPPWPDPALQEPGWYHFPVSVPYSADVENPT